MIDAGNTASLIALFYRGLVRAENLLSVLMQYFAGIAATLLWSLVISLIFAKVVQAVAGLRVSAETEQQGRDVSLHGERAYNM